jgi:hypothetical protein
MMVLLASSEGAGIGNDRAVRQGQARGRQTARMTMAFSSYKASWKNEEELDNFSSDNHLKDSSL